MITKITIFSKGYFKIIKLNEHKMKHTVDKPMNNKKINATNWRENN